MKMLERGTHRSLKFKLMAGLFWHGSSCSGNDIDYSGEIINAHTYKLVNNSSKLFFRKLCILSKYKKILPVKERHLMMYVCCV